jgi:hypothetical protein
MIAGKNVDRSFGNWSLTNIVEQNNDVHVTSSKQINSKVCASVVESITTIILPIIADMIPVNSPSSKAKKFNFIPIHKPISPDTPIEINKDWKN